MFITEAMSKHMLAVARECYILAKREGMSEQECRNAFTLGYIHNIGYEFTDIPENHRIVGYEMIEGLKNLNAIKEHGNTQAMRTNSDPMLRILNAAELSVTAEGEFVGIRGRLKAIEAKYGPASSKYRETRQMAELLGISTK